MELTTKESEILSSMCKVDANNLNNETIERLDLALNKIEHYMNLKYMMLHCLYKNYTSNLKNNVDVSISEHIIEKIDVLEYEINLYSDFQDLLHKVSRQKYEALLNT